MGNNKDRFSVFAEESKNLSKVNKPSYMPKARKNTSTAEDETVVSENTPSETAASANSMIEESVTKREESQSVASESVGTEPEQKLEPASATENSAEETPAEQTESVADVAAGNIQQDEPVTEEIPRKAGRPKKDASASTPYKKRGHSNAGNSIDETLSVTLKLTPYTKALLESISQLSSYSSQSELADAAIHNYIVKEFAQFLPYTDMLFRNRYPEAPDEKQLHKKK